MAEYYANLPPDEDRGRSLLALFYTSWILANLVLAARAFVRIRTHSIGLDDWSMFGAWCLWIGLMALTTLSALQGGFRHIYYSTETKVLMLEKYILVIEGLGMVTPMMAKLSIAATMIRVLGRTTTKTWKILLYSALATYVLTSCLAFVLLFVRCTPSFLVWDSYEIQATCLSPLIAGAACFTQSSLGACLDFALAAAFVWIVFRLKISLQRKIGLSILLGLGVFVGICAVMKTVYIQGFLADDSTWESYAGYNWALAEIALVVICGSLPALKPLYESLVRGKALSATSTRNNHWGRGQPSSMGYSFDGGMGRSKNACSPFMIDLDGNALVAHPDQTHRR